MRVRGALHVHSQLSYDGRLSVAELAEFYRARGFHFVAMGEHSQSMTPEKVRELVQACAAASSPDLCMIPGIEYTCKEGIHILGAGCVELTRELEPPAVAQHIRTSGGFAVLAHPSRYNWEYAVETAKVIQAVEVWNIAYDGKYLPRPQALLTFRQMREINPGLLAVASHDLHRKISFYDVAVEMELGQIRRDLILDGLREGKYRIRSRFFDCDSQFRLSPLRGLLLRLMSPQLGHLRSARDLVVRWSQ